MLLGSPGAIAIFGANVKMNRDVYSSNCCFSAIVSQSGGCEMVWTVPWTPDLLGERSPRCQEHNPPYPPEFREQMVALVRSGRTPESLSREFEPSAQTIHIWVRQADLDQGRRTDNLTSAEREELRRLRRENKQLKIEREILKEAAVWFAQETGTVPLKRTDSRASTGPTIPFVRCVACWASPPAATTRGGVGRRRCGRSRTSVCSSGCEKSIHSAGRPTGGRGSTPSSGTKGGG